MLEDELEELDELELLLLDELLEDELFEEGLEVLLGELVFISEVGPASVESSMREGVEVMMDS